MTSLMTPDEIVRGLVACGVPRERAELVANGHRKLTAIAEAPAAIAFPIRLVLPWSALVSENRRFCAQDNRVRMTAEYRTARAKVTALAERAMTADDGCRFAPLAIPLELEAFVWFPDNRVHDAPNFAGAVHNALKQVVFADDRWIYRAVWQRAGVDCDEPRAELTITPLLESHIHQRSTT